MALETELYVYKDWLAALEPAGFRNIVIESFEEADEVLDDEYEAWLFPWTTIAAETA